MQFLSWLRSGVSLRIILMKCRLCGKRLKLKEYRKHICEACIEKLPKCLQDDIYKLDVSEAKRIISKFHSPAEFTNPDQSQIWFSYGEIGITTTGVVLEKKHIVLFKDIKNFYFDYLPRRSGSENMCFGEFSFNFELFGIPYEFRTLAIRCGTTYQINKEKFHPSFPDKMIKLALCIKSGAQSESHDLTNEKKQYEKEYSEGYYTWRKEAKFKDDFSRKARNKQKSNQKQGESDKTGNRSNRNSNHSNDYFAPGGNELMCALKFFRLSIPYTEQELKSVYRNLIRQCHPDQQSVSSYLKPEDVNRCYSILKKYAS